MKMDFSRELERYHDDYVTLLKEQQDEMRERRNCNRSRIINNIDKKYAISEKSFVIQGSYAMHTMVQDKENDYDIDDGIKIDENLLVNEYSRKLTPSEAKSLIHDIFKDDSRFKDKPSIEKNCVRIKYCEGYHVDIPVYKETNEGLKLAGKDDWEETDPKGVTSWFNHAAKDKSPNDDNDQMRRVVRLFKSFIRNNEKEGDDVPSGFIISKLVDEVYGSIDNKDKERLDSTFLSTGRRILNRLNKDLTIEHPVLEGKMLVDFGKTSKTEFFRRLLNDKIKEYDSNISKMSNTHYENVIKSWGILFNAKEEFEKVGKSFIGPSKLASENLVKVEKEGALGGYACA